MDSSPIVLVVLCVFHLSLSSKAFIFTEEFTWRTYDENSDGSLDTDEFDTLTRYMFRNTTGDPHPIEEQLVTEIFEIFDGNADGVIDREEFSHCWSCWVKNVLSPRSALLIIDVQNDFVNGSLAISNGPAQQDGAEVIGPLNNLLEEVSFDAVFYSKDWHPQNHISFYENVCQRELDVSSSTTNCSEVNLFDTGSDALCNPRGCKEYGLQQNKIGNCVLLGKGQDIPSHWGECKRGLCGIDENCVCCLDVAADTSQSCQDNGCHKVMGQGAKCYAGQPQNNAGFLYECKQWFMEGGNMFSSSPVCGSASSCLCCSKTCIDRIPACPWLSRLCFVQQIADLCPKTCNTC